MITLLGAHSPLAPSLSRRLVLPSVQQPDVRVVLLVDGSYASITYH
jgi:hypothetical protein